MFCSKCGKTLTPGVESCPHCGLDIIESSFEGSLYTSAQSRIMPGDDVHALLTGGVVRRSAPRPAAPAQDPQPAYAPDERRYPDEPEEHRAYDEEPLYRETEDYSGEVASSLEALEDELTMDELDMDRFRPGPIESAGQSGISSDTSEVLQAIETTEQRRAARRNRQQPQEAEAEPEPEIQAVDIPDETAPQPEAEGEIVDDDNRFSEFEEIEDWGEEGRSGFNVGKILKIVAALVLVAGLAVGGVLWFRYVRSNANNSPIEQVRQTLFDEGLALIKQHASQEYEQAILNTFSASGSDFSVLTTTLNASAAEVSALMPDEPTENETLFLSALNQIQKNIGNCITSDAMDMSSTVQTASTPESRWRVVNDAIALLEGATSPTTLAAIANGETVNVQTEAPRPTDTPAPNYNTLSKGSNSDEVKQLQQRLIDLGYLNDTADGKFGNNTMTAVKMFQQAMGLPVTGVADDATLTAVYDENAPGAQQTGALEAVPDAAGADAAGADAAAEDLSDQDIQEGGAVDAGEA